MQRQMTHENRQWPTLEGRLSQPLTSRVEAVRQLRGEADAQIPGVRTSLAHGPAAYFAGAGTVIMTNEP